MDHDEEVVRGVGGDGVAPDVDAPRDGLLGAHRRRVAGADHGRRLWPRRGMWGGGRAGEREREREGRKQQSSRRGAGRAPCRGKSRGDVGSDRSIDGSVASRRRVASTSSTLRAVARGSGFEGAGDGDADRWLFRATPPGLPLIP